MGHFLSVSLPERCMYMCIFQSRYEKIIYSTVHFYCLSAYKLHTCCSYLQYILPSLKYDCKMLFHIFSLNCWLCCCVLSIRDFGLFHLLPQLCCAVDDDLQIIWDVTTEFSIIIGVLLSVPVINQTVSSEWRIPTW